MNAAAPTGHPRGGSITIQKIPCPAVPRRGPEVGVNRIKVRFNGSGVKVQVHTRFCKQSYYDYLSYRILGLATVEEAEAKAETPGALLITTFDKPFLKSESIECD